jgi:thymidylate kinase
VNGAAAPEAEALASGPARATDQPLQVSIRLGRQLDVAGVLYCHWKSNTAIDRSISGQNDIDLLVEADHARRFTRLLSGLGFIRAYQPRQEVPGIESFYGFDAEADRLVHVHAHYKLLVGDDRTKNYRLPIEGSYIRSASPGTVFRLPAVEFEYIALVIRLVLKYCTWDEICWRALRGQRAQPKGSERAEFADLSVRAGAERVQSVLEECLPNLESRLFSECLEALSAEASVRTRVMAARRLEIALQPYARRSRRVDRALRIVRRITLALNRRRRGVSHSRPTAGGAIIGIIGGDGAGKSTALAVLESWLGSEFDVRLVHLGRPRWSATTYAVRAGLKGADIVARFLARAIPVAPVQRMSRGVSAFRPLVWLVCVARDRNLAYRQAHRFALGGGVVLCDRYPHPQLVSMDVPRIPTMPGGNSETRIVKRMVVLEKFYHRTILPPDLLVVLRVDPKIAAARKADESPESVQRRGAEIWNVDWAGLGVDVVDASQSQEAVVLELKALVWSALG